MNILAIPTTNGLSKPISGGQNRFSNLIRGLEKKGNKIIILEAQHLVDPQDRKIAKIYSYKDIKLFNRTLTIFRDLNICFILEIWKIIRTENLDIIQISHPSGMPVVKLMNILTRNKIPIVFDSHNIEMNFVRQTFANNPKYFWVEKLVIPAYTKFIEKIGCKYITAHITAVSEKDKEIFIENYKLNNEKITVIPSGVHISQLPDKTHKNGIKEEFGIELDRLIIFFHGLFLHPSNKDAFETIENYIAPKFEKINKKVLFVVGGTGVPKFERANIKSIGFIKDLYKILSIVDIAIVPLKSGAGTKLKVLDYMGAGLPIVTTKKGIEGINAKHKEHAIIVDDVDKDFIDAIKYLIDNEQERKRIGANVRWLAKGEYEWSEISEKLDCLYKRISLEHTQCK